MEHLQYPIGRFLPRDSYSTQQIARLLAQLEALPTQYERSLANLSEADLAKTYREGSWTVQQLVHHVADVHLLNFLRIKKTLTEEGYVATVADVQAWAATPDATAALPDASLLLIKGFSQRLLVLLKTLDEPAFARSYYHPSRQLYFSLKQALHLTVWHLAHHLAHIELALGRQPQDFRLE